MSKFKSAIAGAALVFTAGTSTFALAPSDPPVFVSANNGSPVDGMVVFVASPPLPLQKGKTVKFKMPVGGWVGIKLKDGPGGGLGSICTFYVEAHSLRLHKHSDGVMCDYSLKSAGEAYVSIL